MRLSFRVRQRSPRESKLVSLSDTDYEIVAKNSKSNTVTSKVRSRTNRGKGRGKSHSAIRKLLTRLFSSKSLERRSPVLQKAEADMRQASIDELLSKCLNDSEYRKDVMLVGQSMCNAEDVTGTFDKQKWALFSKSLDDPKRSNASNNVEPAKRKDIFNTNTSSSTRSGDTLIEDSPSGEPQGGVAFLDSPQSKAEFLYDRVLHGIHNARLLDGTLKYNSEKDRKNARRALIIKEVNHSIEPPYLGDADVIENFAEAISLIFLDEENNFLDIFLPPFKTEEQQPTEREIMDDENTKLVIDFADATDPVEIGLAVKTARKAAGLSQNQLVAKTNNAVSKSTLSTLESGKAKHVPQLSTLSAIGEAVGMTVKLKFEK